jgi:hypothetical protein
MLKKKPTSTCEHCGHTPDPDIAKDRQWMQNDFIDVFLDSGETSTHVFKERAKLGNLRFVEKGKGNLISSMVRPEVHRPILDLDKPHAYVPSSTPGHGHLYLDVTLNEMEHYLLISTLVQLRILGRGSQHQLEAHSMSLTRPPHVKKKETSEPL